MAYSISVKRLRGGEKTHFKILGYQNRLECHIELVTAEEIKVSRHPSQTFNFKRPEGFIEAIRGKSNVVVYVGKVKDEAGNEQWRTMYWEPTDPIRERYGTEQTGMNILPLGSLAWLEMETEFDLQWELEKQQKSFGEYMGVRRQVNILSKRIREVNRDNPYADIERFDRMTTEELQTLLTEMKQTYSKMTNAEQVELTDATEETEEEE